MDSTKSLSVPTSPTGVMPDGTLCPSVLTEDEALVFLRIDGEANPRGTLKNYRSAGKIRVTMIGNRSFYAVEELVRFIRTQTGVRSRSA